MERLRRLWHRLFDERPDDPLPMEAIAGAVVASIAAVVLALVIDGSDFRGYDFSVNILASITLLGPGLVITNVPMGLRPSPTSMWWNSGGW